MALLVDVRAALIAHLRADPSLSGVKVDYAPKTVLAEHIWLANKSDAGQEQRAIASTPVKSKQDGSFPLYLSVSSSADAERNEKRAGQILDHIVTLIAADPYLGLQPAGLQWITLTRTALTTAIVTDVGPWTEIEMTFEWQGRIN